MRSTLTTFCSTSLAERTSQFFPTCVQQQSHRQRPKTHQRARRVQRIRQDHPDKTRIHIARRHRRHGQDGREQDNHRTDKL